MTGHEIIAAERFWQIEGEGHTAEHDMQYTEGELALAAQAYEMAAAMPPSSQVMNEPPPVWPWARECWKPHGGSVRLYTKAGALYMAEAARIGRLEDVDLKARQLRMNACFLPVDRCAAAIDALRASGTIGDHSSPLQSEAVAPSAPKLEEEL